MWHKTGSYEKGLSTQPHCLQQAGGNGNRLKEEQEREREQHNSRVDVN